MNHQIIPLPTTIAGIIFSLTALFMSSAGAELILGAPFTDHMIVQRDKPVTIWGWDKGNTKISISMGTERVETLADSQGSWKAQLSPPPVATPAILEVKGTNIIKCEDVLAGDVWLASGQSNMALTLRESSDASEAMKTVDNGNIRFFQIKRIPGESPQKTAEGKWVLSSKDTAGAFSGVAYYFAERLQREIGVPVGIIESDWGGSSIRAWMPEDVIRARPDYETLKMESENKAVKYRESLKTWEAKGKKGNRPPSNGGAIQEQLSKLDNGMTHPVKRFAIRGVIWYQGESDVEMGSAYREYFTELIASWRKDWDDPKLPVYFAQLPSFGVQVADRFWPAFRDLQLQISKEISETDMAILIDAGDPRTIHPTNKKTPGLRLAQLALAKTYGRDIVPGGPLPEKVDSEGDSITIHFSRTGAGLELKNTDDKNEIILLDKVGKKINVPFTIVADDAISVKIPDDFDAETARYAWTGFPKVTLYNKEGFPATPFQVKIER